MPMSAEMKDATEEKAVVDAQKRAFLKKFGRYAVAGAGMATLMSPTLSSANNYVRGSVIVTKYPTSGGTRVGGTYLSDSEAEAGKFYGYAHSSGPVNDWTYPDRMKRWTGRWTFSENGDFSGSGDLFHQDHNTYTKIGEWSATGHNTLGHYIINWTN